jgi:hypothetical protein
VGSENLSAAVKREAAGPKNRLPETENVLPRGEKILFVL